MRLTLARHGGQAAAIHLRLPPQSIDTASLNAEEAAELARLIGDAMASPPTPEAAPGKSRDAMSYTLTIEDGGRQTVVTQSDTTMSEPFGNLLNWLQRHAG